MMEARRAGLTDDRFASAILLRPFRVNKQSKEHVQLSEYEQQVELKRRLQTMLENEQLIPRVRHDHVESRRPRKLMIAGIDLFDPVSAHDAGQQPDSWVPFIPRQSDCESMFSFLRRILPPPRRRDLESWPSASISRYLLRAAELCNHWQQD